MWLEEDQGGVTLQVWVQPRASKDEVLGVHGEGLKVRLCAPPVDGEANDALTRFLAKRLGVPRSSVELVRGQTSRHKTLRVSGLGGDAVRRALGV